MSCDPCTSLEQDTSISIDCNNREDQANVAPCFTHELLSYYNLHVEPCRSKSNRNCRTNPRCLKGLGQSQWLLKPDKQDDDEKEKNGKDGDKDNHFTGLVNLGATCYINTFLQLWFHNTPLRQAIYDWRAKLPESGDFAEDTIASLQFVFAMMQFSQRPFIDPSPFIKSLNLNEGREEDMHEFSSLFLSLIQKKVSGCDDRSILEVLHDQFLIGLAHITKCDTCQEERSATNDCFELLLRVKGFKNLRESLDAYFEEEKMVDSNRYSCQQCLQLNDARRWAEIRRFPKMLNLQLLRFESHKGMSKKVSTYLRFPKELNMASYAKKIDKNEEDQVDEACGPKYSLHAVLVHEGQSTNSGHYITYIKANDSWFEFNDKSVKKLNDLRKKLAASPDESDKDDLESSKAGKVAQGEYTSKNAYMLVYKLVENIKAEVGEDGEETMGLTNGNCATNSMQDWNVPEYIQQKIVIDNDLYEKDQFEIKCLQQQERATQQKYREMVKTLWDCMPVDEDASDLDLISKDWLISLFEAKSLEEVPRVDNGHMMCPHDRLDARAEFKIISSQCASMIYEVFNGEPRFTLKQDLCNECFQFNKKLKTLKDNLEEDGKKVTNSLKYKSAPDAKMIWVGSQSLRFWKTLAINAFIDALKPKLAQQHRLACEIECFNADLFCEHGNLTSDETKRRLVAQDIWSVFETFFDNPICIEEHEKPCAICVAQERSKQEMKDVIARDAKKQKEVLALLFTKSIDLKWSDLMQTVGKNEENNESSEEKMQVDGEIEDQIHSNSTQLRYHLLSTKFHQAWRKFVNQSSKQECPRSIANDDVICDKHGCFLFPVGDETFVGYDGKYVIVPEEEWNKLLMFYHVERDIVVEMKLEGSQSQLSVTPESCGECFANYVTIEKERRFIYDCASIFVKKINCEQEDEDALICLGLGGEQPEAKKPKTDLNATNVNGNGNDWESLSLRRSTRKRKQKDQQEIKVSSSDKLKDVKVKIMQHFNVATYDQILSINKRPLTREHNNCTLAELEIAPEATIELVVDDKEEETIEVPFSLGECGFKGTQLLS